MFNFEKKNVPVGQKVVVLFRNEDGFTKRRMVLKRKLKGNYDAVLRVESRS